MDTPNGVGGLPEILLAELHIFPALPSDGFKALVFLLVGILFSFGWMQRNKEKLRKKTPQSSRTRHGLHYQCAELATTTILSDLQALDRRDAIVHPNEVQHEALEIVDEVDEVQ